MTALTYCPPAYAHVPEHVGTYGDEVADLAATVGIELDPEQKLVIDGMYAHDERGRLVATEVGCAAPRQNVKTHVGKAASLADLVLFDEPLGLWTAHLKTTAAEVFANGEGTGLADLFENYAHLSRLLDRNGISTDSDEPSITLRRPAAGEPKPQLRFVARSTRAGRGLTGRRVTYDEALFLKGSMTQAMTPTVSARSMSGAVQLRYLGSAGLLESDTWREVRNRGRAGTARRLAWFEWMAPHRDCADADCRHRVGTEGCALDDPELIAAANLALGRRISIDFVLGTERESLTPEAFMTERLGWWQDPPHGGGALSFEDWKRLAEADSTVPGVPALAIDMPPDRTWTSVAAAGVDEDKTLRLEVLEHRRGTSWVVDYVDKVVRKHGVNEVGVMPGSPAGSLIDDLVTAGVPVSELSLRDYAHACGNFFDEVTEGTLRHRPDADLDDAVRGARAKGQEAFTWDRNSPDAVISPLVAVTLAGHLARNGGGFFAFSAQ